MIVASVIMYIFPQCRAVQRPGHQGEGGIGGIARIQSAQWHLPPSPLSLLSFMFLSFPLPLSPPCIPAEHSLAASWVSYPLYSHPSSSSPRGPVGPTFLSGSLRPIGVFTLEAGPRGAEPGLTPPRPHHRGEWTLAEAQQLVTAAGELTQGPNSCPRVQAQSGAATGSPWGPRTSLPQPPPG